MCQYLCTARCATFLFQTGAIKTFLANNNSLYALTFLFQTGAIKTFPFQQCRHLTQMFLFQTGAIKTLYLSSLKSALFSMVSIPNWCD